MPTLNIKDFPERLHRTIQARARRHCRSVAQEVVHFLTTATEGPARRSIVELRGLGKDLWKDVRGAEHVQAERDTWS